MHIAFNPPRVASSTSSLSSTHLDRSSRRRIPQSIAPKPREGCTKARRCHFKGDVGLQFDLSSYQNTITRSSYLLFPTRRERKRERDTDLYRPSFIATGILKKYKENLRKKVCGLKKRKSIAWILNGAGHVDIGCHLFPVHLEW